MPWTRAAYVATSRTLLLFAIVLTAPSCGSGDSLRIEGGETLAELRSIKGAISVKTGNSSARPPLLRERLGDGAVVIAAIELAPFLYQQEPELNKAGTPAAVLTQLTA